MIILDVNKLTINFGYGSLFENLSFSLNEGESISIIGPNGSGKSTLLKIIAGLEKADKGQVSIKKGAKVAYLDQTGSSVKDDRSAYNILKSAFGELLELEKQINAFQQKMETGTVSNKDIEKYCNLMEKFSVAGGYDIEIIINTVVEGLKINKNILNQSYNDLSGGEKTLIQLAKALIIKPDLMLLDEPTNHLDIQRIEWLENYLKSFGGASVIVSHDRYFLNKMSNKILDLDNGTGKLYFCNYSQFIEEKQRDFENQMTEYKSQQNLIKRLDEQRKYFAERGMATNSSSLCDRAHALQSQIERLKKCEISKPKTMKKLNVDFSKERKSSKKIISVKQLTVFLSNETKVIDNINFEIFAGERIALIGANGSGKSTFLKAIMGMQTLKMEGEIFLGPSLKIGYLPQIISFPKADQQLLQYFMNEIGLDEQKARQILAGFQFYQEDVAKRVDNLSGGEKMRIKFAELMQQKINVLIFDEPTNHIDIPTKEVLEEAIKNFDGTLIFVSHDRFFINKFAEKIIEFKNGKIQTYIGNYDYYKQHLK
jgi:ATPase subunit of ABC transporter with duplicated ATPase domains